MEIRFVLPEEVAQLRRNVLTAFPSKTPDELLSNMKSELYEPNEGRYLGCFDDDGTLIGSILMMDFTLNVRGVMMPMGAAAYVSTNFLHKKEHIARNLLRVLMGYYTKLGTAVGCLHPFNPAFYRKMGYGHCMQANFYMPKASAVRSFGHKENLCFAEKEKDMDAVWTITMRLPNAQTVPPYTLIWTHTVFLICLMWFSAGKRSHYRLYSPLNLSKSSIIPICIMICACGK